MTCPRCGETNALGAKFCVQCGAELLAEFVPRAGSPSVLGLEAAAPTAPPRSTQQIGPPAETSGKAIGSLICGIFFVVFPAAVGAIILGHLALSDIRSAAGRLKGRGIAMAGLVLGYSGLFVIPLILIIAAIAIPNLLRAKMAANEASAVGALRTINTATIIYAATYGNGFAPDLETLDGAGTGPANCDHAQLISSALASGQNYGYEFTYVSEVFSLQGGGHSMVSPRRPGCSTPGSSGYEVHADPITRGATGFRSFYTDQTGIIRWSPEGPATAASPPIE